MHKNESYLKQMNDVQLLELVMNAELLGPQYLQALKDQLARLRDNNEITQTIA